MIRHYIDLNASVQTCSVGQKINWRQHFQKKNVGLRMDHEIRFDEYINK